jgi:amino acid adenylation domain-containing protein
LQETALVSEAYHHCPLAHIQSVSKAGSQLFDHLMVFENFPLQIDQNEASAAERHDYIVKEIELFERTNYNFTLMVFPGETVKIKAEYDENICDPVSVNQLLSQLGYILDQVSADADLKLSAICLLSEEESQALAAGFNGTEVDYSEKATLVSILERRAQLSPDLAAVKCGERTLSYGELDQLSHQIGLYLKNNYGIQEGDLVGVLLGREEYLLPVIYGILRSGAAYVPIDVHAPAARQQAIIRDAGLQVVIGRSAQNPELTAESHLLEIETLIQAITTTPIAGALPEVDSHSLAYVIYTSGTTGRPKGVMIEHHSVINRLEWMQKNYPLDNKDVILQKTPVIFDVSVWELFWWSFAGASVYLLEPGGEKDPAVISKAIREAGITTMHFVPSMLNPFLEYVDQEGTSKTLKSLKQVFASGEALPASQVNTFGRLLHNNGTRLINLYGPTEATVDVSYYECDLNGNTTSVPIGKPIDNTKLYVLDGSGQLCPIGMAGELCIAGVGLARGYLNNAELTEQKFTDNPVNTKERIYHTGDLVRWLADGNIEYLGRMDHQVKIRGLRIELGDIESHLGGYPGISACVVMLIKDPHPYLAAYYTGTIELAEEAIRGYLGDLLPSYMVPGVYVRLEAMPLTATGKLDRKALPLPVQKSEESRDSGTAGGSGDVAGGDLEPGAWSRRKYY